MDEVTIDLKMKQLRTFVQDENAEVTAKLQKAFDEQMKNTINKMVVDCFVKPLDVYVVDSIKYSPPGIYLVNVS